jgi:uncharacterized membrane protein YbaN (DUF454 family)
MKKAIHKTSLNILALLSIVIGILGLVLPIIPGLVFLAAGVYFLGLSSPWVWSKLDHIKIRYPRFGTIFDTFDRKISRFIKKAH